MLHTTASAHPATWYHPRPHPHAARYVELYARDSKVFFRDFAKAYAKLLALGCPASCDPFARPAKLSDRQKASAEFRELAMHGSVLPARALLGKCDPHELEATSGRSALHKAAFWGHTDMCRFLTDEARLNVDGRDNYGDTALHDAAKFGHEAVVDILLAAGADATVRNNSGMDALAIAIEHGYSGVADKLKAKLAPRARL